MEGDPFRGAGIDLSVPKVNTGAGRTGTDLSSTPVPLLVGFYQNVFFEPWDEKELHDLFQETFSDIANMSESAKKSLEESLGIMRRAANRISIFNLPPQADGSIAPTRDPQFNITTDQELVRKAYKEKNSARKGSSSKNVSFRRVHEESGGGNSSVGENGEDLRIAYPTYTSMEHIHMALVNSMFDCLNSFFPPLQGSQYIDLVTTYQSLEVGHRYDGPVSVKPRVAPGMRPTPDKSVVIVTSRETSRPVCTIEYKGPRLDLAHHARNLKSFVEKELPEVMRKTVLFNSMQDMIGLPHLFTPRTARAKEDISATEEPASSDTAPNAEDRRNVDSSEEYYDMSSQDMCNYLNYMFCNVDHFYKDFRIKKFTTLNKMKPIAQTLTQGFSTSTGICILNTHQNVIGFEIDRSDKFNRLCIKTTPLLRSDNQRGLVALLLALARRGILKHMEQPGFRMLLEIITKPIIRDAQTRMKKRPLEGKDETDMDNDDDDGDSGDGSMGNASDFDPDHSDDHGQGGGTSRGGGNCGGKGLPKKRKSVGTEKKDSAGQTPNDCSLVTESSDHAVRNIKTVNDVLSKIATPGRVVTEKGSSGAVLTGYANGEVVIKLWSGETMEGLEELCREVKIYKYMEKRCPSILGSAVPDFVAGQRRKDLSDSYGGDVFLVTKAVGWPISRKGNSIIIGKGRREMKINVANCGIVLEAALYSLNMLHQNGILHGDVAFRNLRVRKLAELRWHAWWVDLGRGEIDTDLDRFSIHEEEMDCRAMFEAETAL